MEIDELSRHIVPISLQKALNLSKRYWGRIEWNFLQELGFLSYMNRDQIEQVYAKQIVYRKTTQEQ